MKIKTFVFFLFIFMLFFFLPETKSQIKGINLVVSVTGSFIDYATRDYVSVRYEVYDENGKRVGRGKSDKLKKGYYYVTGLRPGKTYTIKIFDLGYLRSEHKFDIPYTDKYTEYSRDFLVVPRKKNLKMFLRVPPFELGKTKLRYGIEEYLDFYTKLIKRNPRLKFLVQCYPDKVAEPEYNIKLTEGRANTLKTYFVENGAKSEKIYAKGSATVDETNPPPVKKRSKGKRYIGPSYIVIVKVK